MDSYPHFPSDLDDFLHFHSDPHNWVHTKQYNNILHCKHKILQERKEHWKRRIWIEWLDELLHSLNVNKLKGVSIVPVKYVLTDCRKNHGFAESAKKTPHIDQKWVFVVCLCVCAQTKCATTNDIQSQTLEKAANTDFEIELLPQWNILGNNWWNFHYWCKFFF